MKKALFLLFIIAFSCTEKAMDAVTPIATPTIIPTVPVVTTPATVPPVTTPPANSGTSANDLKLIFEGAFVSNAHTTSGIAKVYENSKGAKTLTFENLKSDAGPDLRVYLAEDKAITNFIEISKTVKNGDISYELPVTINISKQKFVLIWCKQFSVLFGSSELKSK